VIPLWLARVLAHARLVAADTEPTRLAVMLAVPDPPSLVAARAALMDPAAPFDLPALLSAYDEIEAARVVAVRAVDREHEDARQRLRLVLARGTLSDLHELWHACDVHMGRGPLAPPEDRAELVRMLAWRPLAEAIRG
jgi:hypothetical protein